MLDGDSLRHQNGSIQHEYAEFNIKLASKLLSLMDVDKGSMIKSKTGEFPFGADVGSALTFHDFRSLFALFPSVDPNYLSTYCIPYVASFDEQLLLGLKNPKDVKKDYFFSRLQNQQLIAK